MTNDEEAIAFDCAGETLIGIVSAAGDRAAAVGVLLVPGAPQYRAGAHRQFVLLARRFASEGIPAMRFDGRGIGDSTGSPVGFLEGAADIGAALAAFRRACPSIRSVVLCGLCDGASAALLYLDGNRDRTVAGMVLLNPWVSSAGEFAQAQVTQSMRRVLTLDFWKKLVQGGIDVPAAVRSLLSALAQIAQGARRAERTASFQERMLRSLETFHGPVLVVLSGRDLVAAEFTTLSAADERWRALLARSNVEQHAIAAADHTFSASATGNEMEALATGWLARSFRSRISTQSDSAICSLFALLLACDAT